MSELPGSSSIITDHSRGRVEARCLEWGCGWTVVLPGGKAAHRESSAAFRAHYRTAHSTD